MPLEIGARIGSYEVLAPLGAGGMGEVYRGLDTNLGRHVAIKVLPDVVAGDAERIARFEREAKTLAALNHPNVGAIYGVQRVDAVMALVLELVDGPTLADRIAQGPIPLDEALPIARQIAEALEAAHEQGIVHRDLKPANVKVRPDGTVKVLDFGLAKIADANGSDRSPGTDHVFTQSPTITTPAMTAAGVILGTAAYMSPEQAKGKPADKRSDIWAFGCVLYEMLTGNRAFPGDDLAETLATVIKSDPDWRSLPAHTPVSIHRLLQRCLHREPHRRLQHIGDARLEIEDVTNGAAYHGGASVASGAGAPGHLRMLTIALGLLSAAALGATLYLSLRSSPAPAEMRVEITTPPTLDVESFAVSPDARTLVFAATAEDRSRLWLRPLDAVEAQPIAGTENGYLPFWSPDSRHVAFFADGKLKRVDVAGGSVQVIADASSGGGGWWDADGTILYSINRGNGPIYRVSAGGGEAAAVTQQAAPIGNIYPQLLPDHQHLLYGRRAVRTREEGGVYVARLDGSGARRLLDADRAVHLSGYLIFYRQGSLFAQRFDLGRLSLIGDAWPVAEQVTASLGGALSVSASNVIAYRSGGTSALRQLTWFDRSGKAIGRLGDPISVLSPSLSPDGKSLLFQRTIDTNTDLWLMDLERGVPTRVTSEPGIDALPVWSPDGRQIAFVSTRASLEGGSDLFRKSIDGSGSDERLFSSSHLKSPSDWSQDGRFLLYRDTDPNLAADIWALPLAEPRNPFPVVQTKFDERDGQFSPDGNWIAYQSDESGRYEIYVQPFPGPGRKWAVSTNGGTQIRWRRDGRELFYVALDGRLTAVPIRLDNNKQTANIGAASPLFATNIRVNSPSGIARQQYVVAPDGQRFLMNTAAEDTTTPPITLILNWKPKS